MSFIDSIHKKPKGMFKLLYWNFFFGYYPIAILQGILALFGIGSVNFNDELLIGIGGFVAPLIIAPFVVLLLAGFIWAFFMVGHYVITLIREVGFLK